MNTLGPRFNQVSSDYRHYAKLIRPGPALITSDVYFKWLLIYPQSLPISEEQVDEAQTFLWEEIVSSLELKDEVGFVVQHRCAEVLILYVCTWRSNNEVWETLYHRSIAPAAHYKKLARQDTSPTFCVWVLSAVAHEQRAWTRYLRSERGDEARAAYLSDQLSDEVW